MSLEELVEAISGNEQFVKAISGNEQLVKAICNTETFKAQVEEEKMREMSARAAGEEEEEIICTGLSWVWQAMFVLGSLPQPCAYLMFGLTADRWWKEIGNSVLGLSASCALLFIFSAPADTRMDRSLAAYTFAYFLVICGGRGLGQYKRGDDSGVTVAGICLVVVWIIFYFILQARKRIARTLTPKQLQDFVVGSVLIYGILKLAGLLYLTAQGYKCLAGGAESCAATTYPVLSISLMMFVIILYKLAIAPLTTTITSGPQVGALINIKLKTRASMYGMMVAGAGNLFLFSSIKEGKFEDPMRILFSVVTLAMVFVMLVELIATIHYQRERRRQTIAIESSATPAPPPSTPQSRGTDDTSKIFDALTSHVV